MEAEKVKLPHLSDEVITEILLKSPPKSVGRFRCLSKLFCSLLSDPKIVRKHPELTLRRSNGVRLLIYSNRLFLVDLDSIDMEREYSFREDLILLSKLTPNPKFNKKTSFFSDPGMYTRWRIHIIGSSKGLVCVRCASIFTGEEDDEVLLYNPTTRESKRIPEFLETVHCLTRERWFYRLGFGFDALSNDYKVVKLVCCEENGHKTTVCYVYSLKSDSWRRINHHLPYYSLVYHPSANLKEAIHWIARIEDGKDRKVLIAFDIEKEELREMPLPNWPHEFDIEITELRLFSIDTFKGCLCVVHDNFMMHNIIWVMNEYGVESSWTKIRINVSEFSIKPLHLTNNHKQVLLVFDGHFVYLKCISCREVEFYLRINTSTYVESLVSPNSYGEQI